MAVPFIQASNEKEAPFHHVDAAKLSQVGATAGTLSGVEVDTIVYWRNYPISILLTNLFLTL